MIPKPTPPTPPPGFGRGAVPPFARAATPRGPVAAQRAPGGGHFGGRVELREASAQRAQSANGLPRTDQYQGPSRWVARP